MKELRTTVGDLRKLSAEELQKMAEESGNPDFVKRLLDEIKSRPKKPGDEKAFIQWGLSPEQQM